MNNKVNARWAAFYINMSPFEMIRLIIKKIIPGDKIDGEWMIDRETLISLQKQRFQGRKIKRLS